MLECSLHPHHRVNSQFGVAVVHILLTSFRQKVFERLVPRFTVRTICWWKCAVRGRLPGEYLKLLHTSFFSRQQVFLVRFKLFKIAVSGNHIPSWFPFRQPQLPYALRIGEIQVDECFNGSKVGKQMPIVDWTKTGSQETSHL